MWAAGLTVAAAAAVATAHGSFQVARAAGVPAPVALLYPAITDGLALVAYATTTRLAETGRRYAWSVVVLAAGLSGIAQAAWLAGGVHATPAALRLGVGAWPATAAAVVAHLLYLLTRTAVQPDTQLYSGIERAVPTAPEPDPDPMWPDVRVTPVAHIERPEPTATNANQEPSSPGDRARAAALAHRDRHDALPTVSQLVAAAQVGRGTAATALRRLRTEPSERSR
jgi:hypothetical protein